MPQQPSLPSGYEPGLPGSPSPQSEMSSAPTLLPPGYEADIPGGAPAIRPPDDRTPWEVSWDQTKAVAAGIPSVITGVPSSIFNLGKAALGYGETGNRVQDVTGAVVGGVKNILSPLTTSARGIGSIFGLSDEPTREEWEQGARSAGANLGGLMLPKVAGVAKAALLTRPAIASFVDAMGGAADSQFVRNSERMLDELKASKIKTTSVESGIKAAEERSAALRDEINKRVTPTQMNQPANQYRQKIIQDQIDAIPLDTDPLVRNRLTNKINRSLPANLTIGDLNQLRSELAATQSPFYAKDVSGQLTMDASARAVDIARGNAVRTAFYDSLGSVGPEVKGLNQGVGAMIHLKDALIRRQAPSIAERLSPAGEVVRKIRGGQTIDQQLASAVQNWKR